MKQTTVGGNKRKAANALAMLGLIIIFIAYMFPFLMVVINSLKQKRDIDHNLKMNDNIEEIEQLQKEKEILLQNQKEFQQILLSEKNRND